MHIYGIFFFIFIHLNVITDAADFVGRMIGVAEEQASKSERAGGQLAFRSLVFSLRELSH